MVDVSEITNRYANWILSCKRINEDECKKILTILLNEIWIKHNKEIEHLEINQEITEEQIGLCKHCGGNLYSVKGHDSHCKFRELQNLIDIIFGLDDDIIKYVNENYPNLIDNLNLKLKTVLKRRDNGLG